MDQIPEPELQKSQPPPPPPELLAWLGAAFNFDELHVRQKLIAIAQKYHVTNPDGSPRFYVVRPPKLTLNMIAGFCASAVRILFLIFVVRLFLNGGPAMVPFIITILFFSNFFLGLSLALISPYRHIEIFSDESQTWRLMTISQDNKIAFWRSYTLYDLTGSEVARFKRNTLLSILRRDWKLETPNGELIARAREDNWVKALLRRYLGPLYGLLRTNFVFHLADGSKVGKYDRRFTIRDQYALKLQDDPQRKLDRRVALAMAILLDTGESR